MTTIFSPWEGIKKHFEEDETQQRYEITGWYRSAKELMESSTSSECVICMRLLEGRREGEEDNLTRAISSGIKLEPKLVIEYSGSVSHGSESESDSAESHSSHSTSDKNDDLPGPNPETDPRLLMSSRGNRKGSVTGSHDSKSGSECEDASSVSGIDYDSASIDSDVENDTKRAPRMKSMLAAATKGSQWKDGKLVSDSDSKSYSDSNTRSDLASAFEALLNDLNSDSDDSSISSWVDELINIICDFYHNEEGGTRERFDISGPSGSFSEP